MTLYQQQPIGSKHLSYKTKIGWLGNPLHCKETSKSINTFFKFTLLKFALSTVQHTIANPAMFVFVNKAFRCD